MSETTRSERSHAPKHVGRSVTRTDAVAKVTGRATYVMDLAPGHLLHARLVPSPVAHGRLHNVDTSAAEAIPGVVTVVTAADTPDTKRGAFIYDQPILADEKVRYIGEPVAIVAAESEEIAEQAVGLVDIEIEPLEAVFDLEEAYERDTPAVIHENVREYEFATEGDPRYGSRGHVDDEDADRPNLLYKDEKTVGDPDAAFEAADFVFERKYVAGAIQHCAMEPHVAIAHETAEGLTLWTSQQVPHNIAKHICHAYPDIEPADLAVKTEYVGGGFGGKITGFLETMIVAVAKQVDRPVRLQLSRAEEFYSGVSRPSVVTRIKDGVLEDGTLIAREANILFNVGAYNEQIYRCVVSSTDQIYGSYDIPNVRWQSNAVYTNLPLYGAFRGFGKPEINWAFERHMNRTAKRLGLDPLEYRAKNLLREGDLNALKEPLGPNDTEGCLRTPLERVREATVPTKYMDSSRWAIGYGTAYASKSIATAAGAVTLKLQRDMTIVAYIGSPDIGQGSDTVFTQLIAEGLGIETEQIRLVTGDTNVTPYTRGPTGSRFTYHTGNAIIQATKNLKNQLFELAAPHFGDNYTPRDLEIDDGNIFVRDRPGESISINDLFSDYDQETGVSPNLLEEGGELIATGLFDSRETGKHACWTPIGQAAVVAVDRLTGRVEVLQFATAADVGKALNPQAVEQQLEGATGQGIASALYEEIIYDNGQVVNPNFKDYRIPGPTELPYNSVVDIFESYEDTGPFGATGVGEAGVLPAAPAIGNAIADATGCELEIIPMTPERIVEALEANEKDTF